jgi:protein-L-isoaspartate(D-aspartate) O-methyltransferase
LTFKFLESVAISGERELIIMSVFADRRRYMVESQLRTNKVTNDKLIMAFESTAKESFIDDELSDLAYIDEDLILSGDRFILEPMVFARMVQALEIQPGDSVLDVGATTGYSTAILSKLAESVMGIESDAGLAEKGHENLMANDIDNAVIIHTPLTKGLYDEAPYNAIIIEGAVEEAPEAVLSQLTEDGRLVVVVRDNAASPGKAVKFVRAGQGFAHSTLFDAQTPFLSEFLKEKSFTF